MEEAEIQTAFFLKQQPRERRICFDNLKVWIKEYFTSLSLASRPQLMSNNTFVIFSLLGKKWKYEIQNEQELVA